MNFHHVVQRDVASDLRVIGEPGEPAKLDQLNKMYVVAGIGPAYQGWYFGKDRWSAHPRQLPCDLPVGDQGVTIRFRMADDVVQAHKDGVLETASLLLDLLFVTSEDVYELTVNGHNIDIELGRWRTSDHFDLNFATTSGHFTAEFDLTSHDCFVEGMNEVRLVLRDRPAELRTPVTFYTLSVDVRYHLIPLGVA